MRGSGCARIAGPGEREVFFSQTTGVVGGEGEGDLVPAHVNIGMVLGLFGQTGDGVDKFHGGGEIFELEGARDDLVLAPPSRQGGKGGGNGGFVFFNQAGAEKFEGLDRGGGGFAQQADAGDEGPQPRTETQDYARPSHWIEASIWRWDVAIHEIVILAQGFKNPGAIENKAGEKDEQLSGARQPATGDEGAQAGGCQLIQ